MRKHQGGRCESMESGRGYGVMVGVMGWKFRWKRADPSLDIPRGDARLMRLRRRLGWLRCLCIVWRCGLGLLTHSIDFLLHVNEMGTFVFLCVREIEREREGERDRERERERERKRERERAFSAHRVESCMPPVSSCPWGSSTLLPATGWFSRSCEGPTHPHECSRDSCPRCKQHLLANLGVRWGQGSQRALRKCRIWVGGHTRRRLDAGLPAQISMCGVGGEAGLIEPGG